ncbi:hypothetical protein CN213_18460 [Sinorhizobium meliloti]|nr:hypothetical protein CN213_18460 [Sinorhizobium meliloti]
MRNEARRTGNVMSAEAAAFGDEFGDNVDRLLTRLQGLKKFLGVQLLPVMNELVESVTKWVDENQELIRSNISDFVRGLGQIIKDLLNPASDVRKSIKDLADGFAAARDTIRPFVDFMGGPLKASLAVIGLWALAPAIGAVSLLAIAFGKLGLAVGGVAVKSIRAIYDSVATAFDGTAATLDASGNKAGGRWGKAFGIAARAAMIAGVALATAELLQTFDPKGNLGGLTTPVDNWMRSKMGLPEKDAGITPGEIWQGMFGAEDDKPEEKKAEVPEAAKLSPVALDLGFADSPIFGDKASKRKDDLGLGAIDPVDVPATVTPADMAVKPVDIPATMKPSDIAVKPIDVPATVKPADFAVRPVDVPATVAPVEVPATVKPADIAPLEVPATLRVMEGAAIEPVEIPVIANSAGVTDSVSKALKPASEIMIDPSRVGAGRDPMEVVPSLAKQVSVPFPTFTPENQPKTVEASSVEAGTMTAGNVQLPEPIIAHEPQNIDASTKIGSITINAKSDDAADIKAAVNAALAENSRRTAAAVKSSLSD